MPPAHHLPGICVEGLLCGPRVRVLGCRAELHGEDGTVESDGPQPQPRLHVCTIARSAHARGQHARISEWVSGQKTPWR